MILSGSVDFRNHFSGLVNSMVKIFFSFRCENFVIN